MTYLQVATRNLLRGTADTAPHSWDAPNVDLIGFQENDPNVASRLRTSGFNVRAGKGPASAVATAYNPAKLTRKWSSDQMTHGGEAGVTPNRYNDITLYDVIAARRPLVHVNKHMISAAWTRHPIRKIRWWIDYWKTAQVLKWAVKMDYHIVVTGDMNRNTNKTGGRLWPKYVKVAQHNGYYDYVLYRPARTESMIRMGGWNGRKAGSDHTPAIASFKIG